MATGAPHWSRGTSGLATLGANTFTAGQMINNSSDGLVVNSDNGSTQVFSASNISGIRFNDTVGFSDNNSIDMIFIKTDANGVRLAASRQLSWSATGAAYQSADIGLSRNAAGFLEVNDGTTGNKAGMKFNGYTTTEKNAIASPSEGMVVYDKTLHKLCVYTGAAWQTITSA